MPEVSMKQVKAGLSGLVRQAANGDVVTITRYGKPVAVLKAIQKAESTDSVPGKARPNFGEYLMQFPGGIEFERIASKTRGSSS